MKDFSANFPAFVSAFAELLIALRRQFGGDLDSALMMAAIGERHFAHRTDPNTPTLETLGRTAVDGAPTINVYSLAQYTGIPRETARRKIAALQTLGWIDIDVAGNLRPTELAAKELRELQAA